MATRVIDDSKLQDIAVAIQGKDGGGTMTVDQMPTRIEQNLQSKAVLDSLIDGSITSIESDVTSIPQYAFYWDNKLVTAKLNSANTVGTYAFAYCVKLKNVYLDNATVLESYAFQSAAILERLFFPNIIRIGNGAFYVAGALTVVILLKQASLSSLGYMPSQIIYYVHPEDLYWYSTATNWSTLYANNRIKSIEDLTGDDLAWYQEQLARYQAA